MVMFMKKMLLANNYEQIKESINYVDAYLIGLKDMCVNTTYTLTLNQLESINDFLKKENKELFILVNKSMHNKDIEVLKDILVNLNKLNIKGIFYSDVAIVELNKKLNLNYDLVWAQEHSTTNYNTINYWYSFGVKYTYVSSDITHTDIINIKKNSKSKLIVPIFGYLPMFVSYRHIVKNYLNYFNLKDDSIINYMEKENKIYPIVDNKEGTFVYSNNILDGLKYYDEFESNNIDYILFNGFDIDNDKLIEVLKIYNNKSTKKINSLFENIDTGFLDRETIYRVKK